MSAVDAGTSRPHRETARDGSHHPELPGTVDQLQGLVEAWSNVLSTEAGAETWSEDIDAWEYLLSHQLTELSRELKALYTRTERSPLYAKYPDRLPEHRELIGRLGREHGAILEELRVMKTEVGARPIGDDARRLLARLRDLLERVRRNRLCELELLESAHLANPRGCG